MVILRDPKCIEYPSSFGQYWWHFSCTGKKENSYQVKGSIWIRQLHTKTKQIQFKQFPQLLLYNLQNIPSFLRLLSSTWWSADTCSAKPSTRSLWNIAGLALGWQCISQRVGSNSKVRETYYKVTITQRNLLRLHESGIFFGLATTKSVLLQL